MDRRSLVHMMLGVAASPLLAKLPPQAPAEPEKEIVTFTFDCDSEQEIAVIDTFVLAILSGSIPSIKCESRLWEATNNKLHLRYSAA